MAFELWHVAKSGQRRACVTGRAEIFLITGGLGFIGKHFVQRCLDRGYFVKNVDRVSYAADREALRNFAAHKTYHFYEDDITTLEFLPECDVVVNFAAESHVDNAITSPRKFCMVNILGVQNLLGLVSQKHETERPLFLQISSDEVYGDIRSGSHAETATLTPSNPYAASKAGADMLVKSWGRTYGVQWNIIRPTNNYGLHQYPEKLIPKSAWRMKRGLPAIMHGDGSYVRNWLHADDTADGILTVIDKGARNSIYNVSGSIELPNIEVLRCIARILSVDEERAWISAEERSGQDVRYSLNDERIRALGWKPRHDFHHELEKIVTCLDVTRFL
jgi:dTDP-glucose 4,6-dehydratase